jgi:hypothetical protein
MPQFYDIGTKKKFNSTKYTATKKTSPNGRVTHFYKTKSPSGNYDVYKIVSKEDYKKAKK